MISQLKIGMFGLGFSALLALTGCQSENAATPASHEMSDTAMRCDKCQVTYVRSRSGIGNSRSPFAYHDTEKMECPDCREKLSNFFETGKILEHTCKACGGNMTPCVTH